MFQNATLHQSQATLVGGRLAQTVHYGQSTSHPNAQPKPLPPSLVAAHKIKSLTKRVPTPTTVIYTPSQLDSAGMYKVFMFLGVYHPNTKRNGVRDLTLVSNISSATHS
jgi:hypothetical protein